MAEVHLEDGLAYLHRHQARPVDGAGALLHRVRTGVRGEIARSSDIAGAVIGLR
jgi:hypothetical protein